MYDQSILSGYTTEDKTIDFEKRFRQISKQGCIKIEEAKKMVENLNWSSANLSYYTVDTVKGSGYRYHTQVVKRDES